MELADAVVDVHDVVARLQVPEIGEEHVALRRLVTPCPDRLGFVEDLLPRKDPQVGRRQVEAGVHETDPEQDRVPVRNARGRLVAADKLGRDVVFAQDVADAFRAPEIREQEDELFARVAELRQVGDQVADVAVVFPRRLRRHVDRPLAVVFDAELVDVEARRALQIRLEFVRADVDAVRGQHGLVRLDAVDVAFVQLRVMFAQSGIQHLQVADDHATALEIVEQRVVQRVDRGKQELEPGEGLALMRQRQLFAQMGHERFAPLPGNRLRPAFQDPGAGGLLAHRDDLNRVGRGDRALALHVEGPQRFEPIAEKLEPHRVVEVRREDVEDAAADGEFARLGDRVVFHVPGLAQELAGELGGVVVPRLQLEAVGQETLRAVHPDCRGAHGCYHHGRSVLQYLPQRVRPRRGDFGVRREAAVRVDLEPRQVYDTRRGGTQELEKKVQLLDKILRVRPAGDQNGGRAVLRKDGMRNHQRPGAPGRARHGENPARFPQPRRDLPERVARQRCLESLFEMDHSLPGVCQISHSSTPRAPDMPPPRAGRRLGVTRRNGRAPHG